MVWGRVNLHQTMVIMGPNEGQHFFDRHGDEDVFGILWDSFCLHFGSILFKCLLIPRGHCLRLDSFDRAGGATQPPLSHALAHGRVGAARRFWISGNPGIAPPLLVFCLCF